LKRVLGGILLLLVGCVETVEPLAEVNEQEMNEFILRVKANQVFVEGGKFLMGDFGAQYGAERLPFDMHKHSSPLHEVRLDAYSIDKHKITNSDFRTYLQHNPSFIRKGKALSDYEMPKAFSGSPAKINWFEAEAYCKWLGDLTELPYSLPTEAQWEYAARSRGRFVRVATDNGEYRMTDVIESGEDGPRGLNISTGWDRSDFAKKMGWRDSGLSLLPVDMFPANPLGLYAMTDNGLEWVKDWYDPEYYSYSPIDNPQGPVKAVHQTLEGTDTRVVRGQDHASSIWRLGASVYRYPRDPSVAWYTARCVVNSPEPLTSH